MLCQFEKLLYPHNIQSAGSNCYMVAVYRPCENLWDSGGNLVTSVKAVGYCLPTANNMRFDLQGRWTKSPKHGIQFEVEAYEEVIIPTRQGVVAYLSSGQIKGIGPKTAEKIYDTFGNMALEVLDKTPNRLLEITGISEAKLKKITESYLTNRLARDVIAYLTPYGISPNRAVRLYKEYGDKTMDIVKNHPYQLCEISGIGFKTADQIAMDIGIDRIATERVDNGILYTLMDAESRGHLCMEKHAFIKGCLKLLDTPQLTEDMIANRAVRLIHSGLLVSYQGNVFREKTAKAEESVATLIFRQIQNGSRKAYADLDARLDCEEHLLKLKLAPEQRSAVKTALENNFAVITGGPGTGKTLIQRAILDIYRMYHPDNIICCCAPTGRAARRMEQSTGCPASTVHKALGLLADEDGNYGAPEQIEADLILVDEVSMLDIYVASHLLTSLKKGCQIILIGDSDQLPSVGPGAVLSEIIASGTIPTVRLDKVFRQKAGSRIAINAKLIRHGNVGLEYGVDFQFVDSQKMAYSAQCMIDLYLQEAAKYGVDNVALLTPYRQKTETCVNGLNLRLREMVNPADKSKAEIAHGSKRFRVGDKVMQIRNHEDVNNGDIGYIKDIIHIADEATIYVDFGDEKLKEYDSSKLDMLDLGYATTIHKSQGSEYKSVIINLQCAHYIMLTRPLIYTAITRGKERVTIVGERKALCMAIKRTDTEHRGTCLAHRLQKLMG